MQQPHGRSETGIIGQCGNCLRTVWAVALKPGGCHHCLVILPRVPLKGGAVPASVGGPYVDKKK